MCRAGGASKGIVSLCLDVCEFCECDKGKHNIRRLSYCGWKSCVGGNLRLFLDSDYESQFYVFLTENTWNFHAVEWIFF